MINTLKKKFILMNMLLVFLVLLVVFSMVCVYSYQQQKDQSLSELSRLLRWHEQDQIATHEVGKDLPDDFVRHPVLVVCVGEQDEIDLIFADMLAVSEAKLIEITNQVLTSGKQQGMLKESNLRYMTNTENNLTQIAFLEVSHEQESIKNTFLIALLSMITALIAFFVISCFLARWILRPIEQSWMQQQRFVADASHELKTPLTVILANNRVLKAKKHETIESQIHWIENTETEAIRMKKLIENLLFLAKSEETNAINKDIQINLSDLILNLCLSFEAIAYEKEMSLNTQNLSPDVYIKGDIGQLKQLVSILLDNAIKYSNKQSIITISLYIRQSKAFFAVHNNGDSISEQDKCHLFERFYQADKSRSKSGYGLGLAIANNIVSLHQGKISVESTAKNGTTFIVSLPIY